MSSRRRPLAALASVVVLGLGLALFAEAPGVSIGEGPVDLLNGSDVLVQGAANGDNSGTSVARGGDVNGDGYQDLLIGAPWADGAGRTNAGSTYVVFGRASASTVDLAALGDRGFRIDGATSGDNSGESVAGAGDVNRDGYDDLVVGAPNVDGNGRTNSGSTYVVFGANSTTTVDLAALGDRGFRIEGAVAGDSSGSSVAGVGDINRDGTPDVLIGAWLADRNTRTDSGSSYVVFGANSTTAVDLAALGGRGFRVDGAVAGDLSGLSVAGPGDVNGDGASDLLIGASNSDPNGRTNSGSSYVVFGANSTTTVDLAALGGRGFRVDGAAAGEISGSSVAGAGDINGDGTPDLLIGAPRADGNGRADSGSSYVVFGANSTTAVDLAALGGRGFRVDGAAAGDVSGSSVAGVGDVNGDGTPDLLIGAPQADSNGRLDSGSSYVVFGGDTSTVDLLALGTRGLALDGAAAEDYSGYSVAGVGDVNGDRGVDLLIGAPFADSLGRSNPGASYVVFGTPPPTPPPTTAPPSTAPAPIPAATPFATLKVKARKKTRKLPRTGRIRVVRKVTVGPGQTARITVKVLPKKSRKTTTVKKSKKRVTVRTKRTPKRTRIRVRITSRGTGYQTTKWVRTWRVR